jgi:drug/metabolite transporter (DMT)-like permease
MATSSLLAARAALLLATVIWGASFVVVQRGLRDLPVFHLLALRFALGGLLILPWAMRHGGAWRRPRAAGLWVGLALFAGFVLQTYGLLWTTPARSAFLTGLTVLLVPLLAWVTSGARPSAGTAAAALVATTGLWVLYSPAAGGAPFGLGDWLTLGCAVAFAAHLLLIERALRNHTSTELAWVQFGVVALFSAPSFLLQPARRAEFTANALAAIGVTAVLATAVAFVCQLYAQRRLGAIETVVILAFEPVVAALTSLLAGAEAFGWTLVWGGSLLVLAMVLAQLGGPGHAVALAPPQS